MPTQSSVEILRVRDPGVKAQFHLLKLGKLKFISCLKQFLHFRTFVVLRSYQERRQHLPSYYQSRRFSVPYRYSRPLDIRIDTDLGQ
jgi:hypothetical protein